MNGDGANLGMFRFERATKRFYVYRMESAEAPPFYVPRDRLGDAASPPTIIMVRIGWGATT